MTSRLVDHGGHRLVAPTRTTGSFTSGAVAMPSGQPGWLKDGGGGLPIFLYGHGLDSTAQAEMTGAAGYLTDAIAAAGGTVLGVQMHDGATGGAGQPLYANTQAMADLDEAVTWARGHTGCAASHRVYIAFSGGGQDVCIHALANLADTDALVLFAPLVDPNGFFGLGGSIATRMDAAYNSPWAPTGGWTANRGPRDPIIQGPNLAGKPIRVYYGTGTSGSWNFGSGIVSADGDGVIPAASIVSFQTAVGSSCSIEAVAGSTHFGTSVWAAQSMMHFLAQHVAFPGAAQVQLVH